MEIPASLESVLREDTRLDAAVSMALSDFAPWIERNRLAFFEEYTDHGPRHVEAVMRNAAGLIAPNAWTRPGVTAAVGSAARTPQLEGAFTARDAAVLVLAALLHDAAMHVTEEGFLQLIDRTHRWSPRGSQFFPSQRDASWPDLWDNYLQQCSRYDEQQLQTIFGNSTPVSRPGPEPDHWTALDRKWIGDFVRRHHSRLAHEIALAGVPGPAPDRIALPGPPHLDGWLCDVAGLVARSHNMDLRAAVDLLPAGSRKNFRGVHAPFIMALLRIADYVDMDAPRAARDLLKVRGLRSPLSRMEHAKHEATVYLKTDDDDPEALWIDAEPKNLQTFLGLRSLYAGLQEELDVCWAVLGEVYRSEPAFGLRIRRVRSNLDDPASLGVEFVPLEARLRTTGAGLIHLLVGPLYDNQAAYGIRELVQNAIDACRELDDIVAHGGVVAGDAPALDADTVVTVEEDADGSGWVTVEDRGIGMTPEVVRDYFLVAGASFRDSDSWREAHTAANGRARFPRAGRFGVGAVAAFLLGDTVEVSTREARQPQERGVAFTCRIDAPLIEMRWTDRPHGTTIRVRVTQPAVFDQLAHAESWDWYRLRTPSLRRKLLIRLKGGPERRRVLERHVDRPPTEVPLGKLVSVEAIEQLPDPSEPVPPGWRRFDHAGCTVMWTYGYTFPVTPDDACNGFVLRRPDAWRVGLQRLWPPGRDESPLYLYRPRASVFDARGDLPIDLRRTAILAMPFERELTSAVCREVFATLLLLTASTRNDVFRQLCRSFAPPQGNLEPELLPSLYHPAVSTSPDEHRTKLPGTPAISWLALAPGGLVPAASVEPDDLRALVIGAPAHERARGVSFGRTFDMIPPDVVVQAVVGHWAGVFRLQTRDEPGVLLVPAERWNAQDARSLPEADWIDAGKGWVVAWRGDRPDSTLERLSLAEAQAEDAAVVFLPRTNRPAIQDPLTRLWVELLGVAAIPLEAAGRRLVLARAFAELHPELERLEREGIRGPQPLG